MMRILSMSSSGMSDSVVAIGMIYGLIYILPSVNITGPNQTWEIGRVSMITRWYVGKREVTNHYKI